MTDPGGIVWGDHAVKGCRVMLVWFATLALTTVGALSAVSGISVTPAAASSPADRWKLEGWSRTDFSRTKIDLGEILSGGPPKDGIPSIDKPIFQPVGDITGLVDNAPVVGLQINGDARAYPLRILMWHEIVNDVVGGTPVTVTYCPLCNAAIVFARTIGDQVLDFGTTGKLRHSDLVMYDRQTESWWQQFTGEAVVGAMLGKTLDMLPSRLESYGEFRRRHPDGKVLIPNNPEMRAYGRNPYVGYDSAARPFLYRGSMPEGIEPMARVVVVRDAGKPLAVAMQLVRENKTFKLGETKLAWRAGQASALDASEIAKGRDVGTITAQRAGANGTMIDVPYDVTFAFVFHAFHPDGEIITK